MADAIVRGTIEENNREAEVMARVSCVRGVPSGFINGQIEDENGREFVFSSSQPVFVRTRIIGNRRVVRSNFRRVTVTNTENDRIFRNCTALLVVRRMPTGRQTGLLRITFPNGRQLEINGRFVGRLIVNRQVVCQL